MVKEKFQKLPGEIYAQAFQRQVLNQTRATKAIQSVLGPFPAQIIQAFVYIHNNPEKFSSKKSRFSFHEHEGHQWIGCSWRDLAVWCAIAKATLSSKYGPVHRLEELRLIHRRAFADASMWRVDFERLALFMLVSLVFNSCETAAQWEAWAKPSGIFEAFCITIREGNIKRSVFPDFEKRTPFAMSELEERLRDELNKTFRKWDQAAFAKLLFGEKMKTGDNGIHYPLPIWKPNAPLMESMPPLHGIHAPTYMESISPNGHESLDTPAKTAPPEYIEHFQSEEEPLFLTEKSSGLRNANRDFVISDPCGEWPEKKDEFNKAVRAVMRGLNGKWAGASKMAVQAIAADLLLAYENDFSSRFDGPTEFLAAWREHVGRYEVSMPGDLYPTEDCPLWMDFSEHYSMGKNAPEQA